MKSVTAVLAFGLIAAVHAQDQCAAIAAKIPSCATECIASAAAGVGCSTPTDFACQCENTAAINGAALNCVLSGCGAQTGLAVQASASAVCDCVSSAGPSAQATESATSPASTPAVQTAPGPEVTAESSPIAASSAAPVTSAAPFPSVNQISDGQVQATSAASPSASGAMMPNTTIPFTGAGVKAVASVGSLMVALGAAIIAL
ncbi:MAG: hypothetical protein Q9217_002005 [Psora testacea]